MKILVTGGTGFTGKALVKRLLDLGHQVVAMDNKEGLKTQELRSWGAEVVIGTVTDRDCVRKCMAGVEIVQHLAAAFREMTVPEQYYWDVNVGGARIMLEEAAAAGTVRKFINCSTCGVHGNVRNPPAGEDAPIEPADYYQRTKYEAEPVVQEFFQAGRLKTVTIRPAAIYGPGDPERFFLIYKKVASGTFPVFGDGKTLYHPVYIDNLVDSFVLAMEPGRGDGRAYLIADEEYVQIEDLVKRIGRAMGVDVKTPHYPVWPVVVAGHVVEAICKPLKINPPLHPRRVDWFRMNRAFKIDAAKRDLGYAPKIGLDEGLKRTYLWYKQEGFLK